MRALILLHRWLGVSFSLLFAMWFSTGIVMHFVPFPGLTEAERIDGLTPIDPSQGPYDPAAAVNASGIKDATRVRLLRRSDGPVYVVTGRSGVSAVRADDRTNAAIQSAPLALTIAEAAARQRGRNMSEAALVDFANYDQWTVPNGFDRHRPLYRIALNDNAGTELYVSSVTGEVVLNTTRGERAWNYVGSVAHWIYPTLLRRSHGAWDATVWSVSLVALIVAISGGILGIVRMKISRLAHRLTLFGVAEVASCARAGLHDLRADLDVQWLVVDGPRPVIFNRKTFRRGNGSDRGRACVGEYAGA